MPIDAINLLCVLIVFYIIFIKMISCITIFNKVRKLFMIEFKGAIVKTQYLSQCWLHSINIPNKPLAIPRACLSNRYLLFLLETVAYYYNVLIGCFFSESILDGHFLLTLPFTDLSFFSSHSCKFLLRSILLYLVSIISVH